MITLLLRQLRGASGTDNCFNSETISAGRPVHGHRGPRYEVLLDGEVLLADVRDPEHDAARVLQARGLTGPFRTTDEAGRVRMEFASIEEAAKWRVEETEKVGPKLRRWTPSPWADRGGVEDAPVDAVSRCAVATVDASERVGGPDVAPRAENASLDGPVGVANVGEYDAADDAFRSYELGLSECRARGIADPFRLTLVPGAILHGQRVRR